MGAVDAKQVGGSPPSSGGFRGLGLWNYRTATASTPSAGRMQFDDTTIEDATEMYVHQENNGGTDVSVFLDDLVAGDQVYVQIQDDGDQFIIVKIGTPTKAGSVYTFPIDAIVGQGSAPNNNTGVAIITSTGSGSNVNATFGRSITIENPTSADNFALFFSDGAITISQLNFVLQGVTSATVFVRYDSDRSAVGTAVINAGTVISSSTTGQEITSFDNAVIPAGSWIWIEVTALVGTPDELNVSVIYT